MAPYAISWSITRLELPTKKTITYHRHSQLKYQIRYGRRVAVGEITIGNNNASHFNMWIDCYLETILLKQRFYKKQGSKIHSWKLDLLSTGPCGNEGCIVFSGGAVVELNGCECIGAVEGPANGDLEAPCRSIPFKGGEDDVEADNDGGFEGWIWGPGVQKEVLVESKRIEPPPPPLATGRDIWFELNEIPARSKIACSFEWAEGTLEVGLESEAGAAVVTGGGAPKSSPNKSMSVLDCWAASCATFVVAPAVTGLVWTEGAAVDPNFKADAAWDTWPGFAFFFSASYFSNASLMLSLTWR